MHAVLLTLTLLLAAEAAGGNANENAAAGGNANENADAVDAAERQQAVLVVVGAPGNDEYAAQFAAWADRWREAAAKAEARCLVIGQQATDADAAAAADRELLQQHLAELAARRYESVWLVLIGHGTFDGRQAKFNLRGPDVTATELATWLKPLESPLAVINSASASGPFLNELSAAGRVVVTATKSGHEHNFARFGEHISAAITDPAVDLDKDGQTSLLEAYLAASSRTAEFYEQEGRLATEHALLDDNGDGLGTPADWFRGFRAVRRAKEGAAADGQRASQFVLLRGEVEQAMSAEARRRRDALEAQLAELREKKAELDADEYFRQLEAPLLELARLYAQAEAASEQEQPAEPAAEPGEEPPPAGDSLPAGD